MPHLDVRYFERGDETVFSGLEARLGRGDDVPGHAHYVWRALFQTAADAGARLIMDGHGGDTTLNPRGQGALAWLLRAGHWRRFAAEFGAHVRMSGRPVWRTLKSDVLLRLAPHRLRRGWLRMRRQFAPLWTDRPIAAAFARSLIAGGYIGEERMMGATRDLADMRGQLLRNLRFMAELPSAGFAVEAASFGLDMTRPFHDRRVVELALAIPEELYVKNGRNRYLACRALGDIYPAEYQTRIRRTETHEPDFDSMLAEAGPQLTAEAQRLAANPRLSKYIDFAKAQSILADETAVEQASMNYTLRAILTARYIAWFRGENR